MKQYREPINYIPDPQQTFKEKKKKFIKLLAINLFQFALVYLAIIAGFFGVGWTHFETWEIQRWGAGVVIVLVVTYFFTYAEFIEEK